MDRNELKIQALLEKLSNITANYENQIADLRVELTLLSAELEESRVLLAEKEIQDEDTAPEADNDKD